MSTFHPFPRLPLELRQSIWTMAIEPRLVRHKDFSGRKRTPPPPLLGVCCEARSFLLQHSYTKAFISSDSAQYHYVDFEVDTISLAQCDLGDYPREHKWIQQLSIVCWDTESYFHKHQLYLREMPALKDLTIHHWETGPGDHDWWRSWNGILDLYYSCGDPVPYFVRVLGPPNVDIPEINRNNYRKVERDDRRRRLAEITDDSDDYFSVSSDTEEELDSTDRV
ncbi:hypothetical protein PG990_012211 [Apiospora arundinis]